MNHRVNFPPQAGSEDEASAAANHTAESETARLIFEIGALRKEVFMLSRIIAAIGNELLAEVKRK